MKYLRSGLALLVLFAAACSGGGASDPSGPVIVAPPDYAGNWDGSYTISSCTQTGQIAVIDLCGLYPTGTALSHRFEFTQNGSRLEGQFFLGELLFSFPTATINSDGSVTVRGTFAEEGVLIVATWTIRKTGSAITGTVTQAWTAEDATGVINVSGSITSTTQSTSIAPSSDTRPMTLREKTQSLR